MLLTQMLATKLLCTTYNFGVSSLWNGLWNGLMEWTMEWTIS